MPPNREPIVSTSSEKHVTSDRAEHERHDGAGARRERRWVTSITSAAPTPSASPRARHVRDRVPISCRRGTNTPRARSIAGRAVLDLRARDEQRDAVREPTTTERGE
jgi:hypothetical protein